jgi:hypothetical protein
MRLFGELEFTFGHPHARATKKHAFGLQAEALFHAGFAG